MTRVTFMEQETQLVHNELDRALARFRRAKVAWLAALDAPHLTKRFDLLQAEYLDAQQALLQARLRHSAAQRAVSAAQPRREVRDRARIVAEQALRNRVITTTDEPPAGLLRRIFGGGRRHT
jgi:hypothetical protein